MDSNALQRKTFSFDIKESKIIESGQFAGEFTGYAAAILNLDSAGDMILPGAFLSDIPRFLKEGVVCYQHDWMSPIGIPLEANEDSYGLITKSRISRTQKGLEAMTLIRDGVIKKLSIGYQVLDYEVTDKLGMINRMAEYNMPIDKQQQAMTSYDEMNCDKVYLLKQIKLYEFSPVTVPANNNAIITDAKSLIGLTFQHHYQLALNAVESLETRIKEIDSIRKSQKRKSSVEHGKTCQTMADDLQKACDRLRKMAEELGYTPENETTSTEDVKAIYYDFLKLQANI